MQRVNVVSNMRVLWRLAALEAARAVAFLPPAAAPAFLSACGGAVDVVVAAVVG